MTTVGIERLWTVEDVAMFLGVPVRTLYDWRRNKRGPVARRVGKYLRYDPRDVWNWLDTVTS